MITEHKLDYYIGTIVAVVDNASEKPNPGGKPIDELLEGHTSQEHIAIVTIPGVAEYLKVFPGRNQIDEPKIEDLVLVAVWDPAYQSYCTYEKLKENDFVGFRAHGKMIDITHEKITVGVFDESTEYKDLDRPDVTKLAHVEMTSEGAVTVHAAKDITVNGDSNVTINIKGNNTVTIEGNNEITIKGNNTVTVEGNKEVTIKGNTKASVSGNLEAQVNGNAKMSIKGSTKIDSPDVTITGGKMTVRGTATPDMQGPWCAVPNCIFSGAPHSGSMTTT